MVDETELQENGQNTRREFLKKSGAASIGLSFINNPLADRKKRIVISRHRETGEVVKEKVSKKWWKQAQKVEEVKKKIESELMDEDGVASVGIGKADSKINGRSKLAVRAGVRGDEDQKRGDGIDNERKKSPDVSVLRKKVADKTGKVPDRVVEEGEPNFLCYEGSYNDLKGGISIEDSFSSVGSVCGRAKVDGSEHLVTARHIPANDPCTKDDQTGKSMWRNGEKVGEIAGENKNHDIVWVELEPDQNITNEIVDLSYDQDYVMSKSGMKHIMTFQENVGFRGITSCDNNLIYVNSIDNSFSCNDTGLTFKDLVYYDGYSIPESGDSGGPAFYDIDSDDDVVSHTGMISGTRSVNGSLFTFGAAGYASVMS